MLQTAFSYSQVTDHKKSEAYLAVLAAEDELADCFEVAGAASANHKLLYDDRLTCTVGARAAVIKRENVDP